MTTKLDPTVVACSLERSDFAARAERWRVLRAEAAVGAVSTSRGLRLTFRGEPGVAAELEELLALERNCCAFAGWSLAAANGRLVLEVTGESDAAVEAVQAMFGGPQLAA